MSIQAGWYPDPSDPALVRYWDGAQWTGQVQKSFRDAQAERKSVKKRQREQKHQHQRRERAEHAKDRASQHPPEPGREPKARTDKNSVDRPDIRAAAARMSWKLGSKREVRKLAEHLWPDETARMITAGTYGPGRGVIVLTDKRLFFLKDGLMSNVSEDFPLAKISSIQWSSGVMFGKITVFVSGNQSIITNMMKDDGHAIVAAVRADVSGLRKPPEPAAPTTSASTMSPQQSDPLAQLKALGELRDTGVLTNEEFEEKKSHLLNQIG